MLVGNWGGLEKESHSFLLVCRHWFEIASCSPELWSFWGNTLKDWKRWHSRSTVAPLDLVLAGTSVGDYDHLDATVSSAIRDYATRGAIRRVHLDCEDETILDSVFSSLTPEDEGVQSSQIKSLILMNWNALDIDVSVLFARYSFPKLQCFDLHNYRISSWDHIGTRTGALTELGLFPNYESPSPSTPQLFSLLTSNPALQTLKLCDPAIPTDDYKLSSFRIPLHHLKVLKLAGELRDVFNLLYRLDHPILDKLEIFPSGCTVADISQVIGPYLRNYLKHRTDPQSGLGLCLSDKGNFSFFGEVDFMLRIGDPDLILMPDGNFVSLKIEFDTDTPTPLPKKAIPDLIAHVPLEKVTHFWSYNKHIAMCDIYSQLPNLESLIVDPESLSEVFPGPDTIESSAIPVSLKSLTLKWVEVDNGDWSSLLTFLARRVSAGNPLQMLTIAGDSHMCLEIVEDVKRMVEVTEITGTDLFCPLGVCPNFDPDHPP